MGRASGTKGIFIVYLALEPRHHTALRQRRVAIGIVVSLALHALLLSAWRGNPMRSTSEPAEPPRSIAVWIRPPPASQQPGPAQPTLPARPPARAGGHQALRTPPAVRPQPQALEPLPVQPPSAPQQPSQAAPAPATPATPHFDRDAARQFARRIATLPDPAWADTPVGQFPEPDLQPETRAARAIAATKRPDCKDGVRGGLLAPLILLLDKKDSGCKM
jgi:type IV secretory pathway VirB10-like protein